MPKYYSSDNMITLAPFCSNHIEKSMHHIRDLSDCLSIQSVSYNILVVCFVFYLVSSMKQYGQINDRLKDAQLHESNGIIELPTKRMCTVMNFCFFS